MQSVDDDVIGATTAANPQPQHPLDDLLKLMHLQRSKLRETVEHPGRQRLQVILAQTAVDSSGVEIRRGREMPAQRPSAAEGKYPLP